MVVDFGVAKALTAAGSDATGLTTSGLAVGTPAYMSPEQAAGDARIDARADVYALGCVAYEILSGKPPFTDPSAARMLVAQVSQMPVPLYQVAPVKMGMSAVIMRCLEKNPGDRWPAADALADAFEQQRFTAEVTPIPEVVTLRTRTPAPPAAAALAPAPGRAGRKWLLIVGVLLALATAAFFALSIMVLEH